MSVNWLVEDPMMATRTLQMKRRGNNWNYTNQSHFMTGLAKPRPQERYWLKRLENIDVAEGRIFSSRAHFEGYICSNLSHC